MIQNNEQNIKLINEQQHNLYETYEKRFSAYYVKLYSKILKTFKTKEEIKILDIGGASGYFALELYKYFEGNNCKIVVLDTVKFDTWLTFSEKIDFVESSVDDVHKLFGEETFDIIFANRVFHHFIRNTWTQTMGGMKEIVGKIYSVLKPSGYFCISDHFYNGFLYDEITSRIIYTLTSSKIPLVKKVCQKLEAQSSGTGVCFLSKKMWVKLLSEKGFTIALLVENKNQSGLKAYKKIALCSKSVYLNNVIICKKAALL